MEKIEVITFQHILKHFSMNIKHDTWSKLWTKYWNI